MSECEGRKNVRKNSKQEKRKWIFEMIRDWKGSLMSEIEYEGAPSGKWQQD